MKNKICFFSCMCLLLVGYEEINESMQDPESTVDQDYHENEHVENSHKEIIHDYLVHKQLVDKKLVDDKNIFGSEPNIKNIVLSEPIASGVQQKSNQVLVKKLDAISKNKQSFDVLDSDFDIRLHQDEKFEKDRLFSDIEKKEIVDFIGQISADQNKLLKTKLSDAQIKIIKKVTQSYLDKFSKKLLKKSFKRFFKNMIMMIFKEVRIAQKNNNAITDRDMWVICKKVYDQKLKLQKARKTKYIKENNKKKFALN